MKSHYIQGVNIVEVELWMKEERICIKYEILLNERT